MMWKMYLPFRHLCLPLKTSTYVCWTRIIHCLITNIYKQDKWRKIHTWTQVSPAYQSILAENEFHVFIHLNGINNHYVFFGENFHELEFAYHNNRGIPYRLLFSGKDDLMLINKEIQATAIRFDGQVFL